METDAADSTTILNAVTNHSAQVVTNAPAVAASEATEVKFHPYLRLPQELQDMVVAFACVRTRRIFPAQMRRTRKEFQSLILVEHTIEPKTPSLAAVSRKLRKDTLDTFFGRTTFVFKNVISLRWWAAEVLRRGIDIQSLSHVVLEHWLYVTSPPVIVAFDVRMTRAEQPLQVIVSSNLDTCTCAGSLLAAPHPTSQHQATGTGSRLLDSILEMPPRTWRIFKHRKFIEGDDCSDCGKPKVDRKRGVSMEAVDSD